MSALRRVVTNVSIAALAAASACAHGRAGDSSAPTVFESDGGNHSIIFTSDAITVDGTRHPMIDCSDEQFVCASSDIGFHVLFPRKCPTLSWIPKSGPMQWRMGFPHSYGARYTNREKSHFIYDWDTRHGLTALVFDPSKDFVKLSSDDTYQGAMAFYRKLGPSLFPCA